ncbi:MAG: PEP-CTERM sorting domain-containing protein, partial [Planctomycetales bacterium]|nr:PEP-CTERM sorting domain-containing protein [Planctomycetales bacterium]
VDESGLFGFAPNPTGGVHIGAPAVIRVVAVPEPSTLGILSLLVAPTVLRRRRRRRRRSI